MKTTRVTNTEVAKLSWDKKDQPRSQKFDDIYFSDQNGDEESLYVFVKANALSERWRGKNSFTIGETGFGTGLNFLVTWQAWLLSKPRNHQQLHFLSVEKHPLSHSDLRRSLALWPRLRSYSAALIEAYPPQPISGLHRLYFNEGKVTLTIYFGDAAEGFEQLSPITKAGPFVSSANCSYGNGIPSVDAWFLDGFAPQKNPDMWSDRLLIAIKKLSLAGSTLSTFTSAGSVKKKLENIGFQCKKRKGFGRKREMLTAIYSPEDRKNPEAYHTVLAKKPLRHFNKIAASQEHSWHLVQNPKRSVEHCAVIGGGLAGTHTAFALAQKGIKVTLIERKSTIADAASGNHQAAVYAKLSPHSDPLSQFNFTSFLYANHFYRHNGFYRNCGQQCGVIHLATDERRRTLYKNFLRMFDRDKQFVQWFDSSQSREVSGIRLSYPGLLFPQAGWLSPRSVCNKLVAHSNVSVITNTHIKDLVFSNNKWSIFDSDGATVCQADAVVLANANNAMEFHQCAHFPLKSNRGQVSHANSNPTSENLRSVVCAGGYIVPADCGIHTFGATYSFENLNTSLADEDHEKNLNNICAISKEFSDLKLTQNHSGRSSLRCTTPDYFPLAGPVANYEKMKETFHFLKKKGNAKIDAPGSYHPNLYCNLGHGSRGLCYIPLCAELIATILSAQFTPLTRELYRYVHPARFVIRDLMRNKI